MIRIFDRNIRVQGNLVRLAQPQGDRYRFLENPAAVVDDLRHCGTRVDIFSFAQRLPETKPLYPYPMEWDNYAVLQISTFENWWTTQIGFKARNKAKQAEKKGVSLREVTFDESLVRGIWEIYNECPIRQRRRFPHYGKDVQTVHRDEATFLENSVFIGAYHADKLIGFIKLVVDETGRQAGLMNIVSMIRHRDKAPQNALIAHAVRACANRGIQFLVYSRFAYGKKQQDSLSDFKERNGFKRVEVPRYHVPLTRLGALVLRLGLHHRLAERVPDVFAARLRDLRAAWYERRYGSMSEAY
ncbi:MAG TPA: hypothetical protein VFA90_20640 [Terriglobales bacterium]|nr:hypothetical protein [Terriglobales bacterium]